MAPKILAIASVQKTLHSVIYRSLHLVVIKIDLCTNTSALECDESKKNGFSCIKNCYSQ